MSIPTPPRRRNRAIIAALIVLGACAVLLLGVEFLLPEVSSTSARPTQILALGTKSGGGGGFTRTPFPTFADVFFTETPTPTGQTAEGARGDLQFDYPLTLVVGNDDVIKLQIVPEKQLAAAAPLKASNVEAKLLVETDANQPQHKSVSYEIPIYAVMSAELNTASTDGLNIVAGAESKQTIDVFGQNFWTWSVVAKRGGEYHVTLRIFGYNQLADTEPAHQVVNDTRIINVQDRSFFERLGQGIADNWLVLFGAGGPIALIVLVLTFYFSRKEAQKPKANP